MGEWEVYSILAGNSLGGVSGDWSSWRIIVAVTNVTTIRMATDTLATPMLRTPNDDGIHRFISVKLSSNALNSVAGDKDGMLKYLLAYLEHVKASDGSSMPSHAGSSWRGRWMTVMDRTSAKKLRLWSRDKDWGGSLTNGRTGHSAGEPRIGACPKKKKPLRDISDGRRHEKRDRKRRGERPRGAI